MQASRNIITFKQLNEKTLGTKTKKTPRQRLFIFESKVHICKLTHPPPLSPEKKGVGPKNRGNEIQAKCLLKSIIRIRIWREANSQAGGGVLLLLAFEGVHCLDPCMRAFGRVQQGAAFRCVWMMILCSRFRGEERLTYVEIVAEESQLGYSKGGE